AQVDVGSQFLDEIGLELLRRRLEHQSLELHAGAHDLVDNSLPQVAVGVADPASPTLTCFCDDQRSACLKVLPPVSGPFSRCHRLRADRVLVADLAPAGELM